MPILIIPTLLLALVFLCQAARRRRQTGLPGGRIIYTDTRSWGKVDKPLYDPILDLTGKPDYLVDQGKAVIPVEVKTGRTPPAPYDSHIFQLAAYCLLVHRTFRKRPPHGLIKYPQRTFQVDYTPELENALLDLLVEIRQHQRKRAINRSHDSRARCRGCGFRACDQRIP
ncbi:MAG: PD-(D/E)XK nuclease family protein [Anaerolineales bacterium]